MKNLLLIAALTLASAPAFASKARLGALQNGMTTATDIQQVFEAPSKMWDLADQVTFEFGATGTTYAATGAATENSPAAEGGFIRSHGDSKWGAYLGHQSESLLYMLSGTTSSGATSPVIIAMTNNQGLRRLENPINLWYGMKAGDLKYGFNLFYAASEKKNGVPATGDMNKKSAQGLSLGVGADTWNANLVVGLGAKVESNQNATDQEEFKGTTSFKLQGEYVLNENMLVYGQATNFGGKHTTAAGVENMDLDHQSFGVGVESKVKSDIAHFYYGAMVNMGTEKNKVTGATVEKVEQTTLPVYFGLEADAASWLVLRASLKQNVLLNSTKVSTATTSEADDADTTTAALGMGFKFGKLMLDGVAAAGTSGTLSTTNFATNASLTYNF